MQKRVFPFLDATYFKSLDATYLATSQSYDPQQFINVLSQACTIEEGKPTIISQETLSGRGDGDPIWNQFEPNAYPAMKPNSVEELRHHFKKHTRMQDKIRNTSAVESLHPRIKKYLI